MADSKKNLYNIAINGQGYILSGLPKSPARVMRKADAIGVYPTEIDLEYKDSSALLPWAQTDWSGGFQSEKWEDNARFKSGSGLEYIQKYGQLSLLNTIAAVTTIGAGYTFGSHLIFNQTLIIGVNHATLAVLKVLDSADAVTTPTTGWTAITKVNSMEELHGKAILALTRSGGVEKCLQSFDGTNFADATGTAVDSSAWRMAVRAEDRIYASNFNSTANGDRLLYSDNDGTTWTVIITATGRNRQITKGVNNLGIVFFIIEDFPRTELWQINDTTVTQIYRWENLTNPQIKAWLGKVYVEGKENGKLVRFEWNGAVLKTVFQEKVDGLDLDTSPMTVYKNNLHSYGLVFDGLFHFPSHIQKYAANKIYPFEVFGGTSAQVIYFYGLDTTSLKISKLNTTAFLATGNTITGIFSAKKAAVDKLWHSITLSFKALVAGQTMVAEYSTDDETTWNAIGTISPVAGETEKTLYFAANVKSKRVQVRLTLTGGGTNTPTLYDFVVRHLPLADDRFSWALRLNCSDKLMLLDGKSFEPKKSVELRNLLHIAEFQNNIVEFQDVDFAETLINDAAGITAAAVTITVDSTQNFPEQGRIKIEQEEILYTGKTALAFTGCTRGQRGTRAMTHADNIRVHTSYNVLVRSLSENNPVAPEARSLESNVEVSLLEI